MFKQQQYLTWLIPYYGRIQFDLATSSAPNPGLRCLEPFPPLDDYGAAPRLRADLAQRYHLPLEEVQLTLGTSQGLFATLAYVLKPGDRVLVECPTYEPLWSIPEVLGAQVDFLPRSADGSIDLTPWSGQGIKVVLLANPHNPSGVVLPMAHLLRLAEWCAQEGAWLLIDEVYVDFGQPELVTHRHLHPRIITVSSLTKVYGLGALRCGWVLAPPQIAQGVEDVTRYLNGSNPPGCAALGLAALAHRDWFWQLSQERARVNFPLVADWVSQQPALTWEAPSQGLFGFVRHQEAVDLRALIERGCEELGVLVVPGEFFGAPDGFRISWGAEPGIVAAGLERLSVLFR